MEQLAVGVWRAAHSTIAQVRAAILNEWADTALAQQATQALTVNLADIDQGNFTRKPDAAGLVHNADALIVVGLSRAHDLDDLPCRDLLHSIARRVDVWRITAHVRKLGDRATADGQPTPGLKLVSFMRRADGLSHEQFVRHWTERHTPLALEHHVGLSGYTQNVVTRAYTPGGAQIDGIAELQFRTRDDYEQKFFDSDEGREVIMADVPRFMRQGQSSAALMTEYIMRSAP